MKGHAKVEIVDCPVLNVIEVSVPTDQKDYVRSIVNKANSENPDLNFELIGKGKITAKNSSIFLLFEDMPFLRVETIKKRRTTSQHTTLRGIERFIFYAENGYEPTADDMYWIHEGLLEKYSTWVTNPRSGVSLPKRTSDPSMTTTEMAKIVEGALNELASKDIPKEVLDSIGHKMKTLWENWYIWRYNQNKDPLFEVENGMSWEKYRELHPVCELCGLKGVPDNPIERMHIISAGADKAIYEMPWNWIASHRSHHQLQHNEGWDIISRTYPHIKGKLKRALILRGKISDETF